MGAQRWLGWLLLCGALAGCVQSARQDLACEVDDDCAGDGYLCVNGRCTKAAVHPLPSGLRIDFAAPTVQVGTPLELTVTALDSRGQQARSTPPLDVSLSASGGGALGVQSVQLQEGRSGPVLVVLDRPGQTQVTATGAGLTASATGTVTPGPASRVYILGPSPSPVALVTGRAVDLKLQVRDARDNPVTSFAGTVTLNLSPSDPDAVFPKTLRFLPTDGPEKTFTLTPSLSGASFTLGGVTDQGGVTVEPLTYSSAFGAVTQLRVLPASAVATADQELTVTVEARDAENVFVANYGGTAQLRCTEDPSVAPPDVGFVAGRALFHVRFQQVGAMHLVATDTVRAASGTSEVVNVVPAPVPPVVTAPASALPYSGGLVAQVVARPRMTYEWALSAGTFQNAHGPAGETDGGLNTITFAVTDAGALTVSCLERNELGTPSAPGSATVTVACPGAKVLCGTTCVDLAVDPANCGACGYRVIGASLVGPAHRDCVNGKPSPGWVALSSVNAPGNSPLQTAWTGKRLLHVDAAGAKGFDPLTDAWTTVAAPPAMTNVSVALLPDRRKVVFWASQGVWLFDDSGSTPSWKSVAKPASLSPGTGLSGLPGIGGLAYDGTNVYFVSADTSGAILKVADLTWRTLAAASRDVQTGPWNNGQPGAAGGAALAAGYLVAPELGDYRTSSWHAETMGKAAFKLDLAAAGQPQWMTNQATGGGTFQTGAYSGLGYADGYPTLLSVGNRIFHGGHWSWAMCEGAPTSASGSAPFCLYDPSTNPSCADATPQAPSRAWSPFVAFTGRAIFLFGGSQQDCAYNQRLYPTPTPWLGLVTPSGIVWSADASPQRPTAAHDALGRPNTQHLWSGSEMFIAGGNVAAGPAVGGFRYQPPVGCVCPTNADAPAWFRSQCTGVTNIADLSCTP